MSSVPFYVKTENLIAGDKIIWMNYPDYSYGEIEYVGEEIEKERNGLEYPGVRIWGKFWSRRHNDKFSNKPYNDFFVGNEVLVIERK